MCQAASPNLTSNPEIYTLRLQSEIPLWRHDVESIRVGVHFQMQGLGVEDVSLVHALLL